MSNTEKMIELARDLRETAGLLCNTKYDSRVQLLEEAATIIEDMIFNSSVVSMGTIETETSSIELGEVMINSTEDVELESPEEDDEEVFSEEK